MYGVYVRVFEYMGVFEGECLFCVSDATAPSFRVCLLRIERPALCALFVMRPMARSQRWLWKFYFVLYVLAPIEENVGCW